MIEIYRKDDERLGKQDANERRRNNRQVLFLFGGPI